MNAQTTQITEYSATEAGLAELRSRMANVVYDVKTADGMAAARKDRRECVTLRTALEDKRKEVKAAVLERGRLIDSEAKRINDAIIVLEQPIDVAIQAEEERKRLEKEERDRIERNRVAEIRARIERMARRPIDAIGLSTAGLDKLIEAMLAYAITNEVFQEFTTEAQSTFDSVLAQLREARGKKAEEEAEAARLKAEREDLDRRKREQDERERVAKEEQARVEAAAKAERDRVDREDRERREAEEKTAREAREEQDRQAKAKRDEDDRIAREKRETENAELKRRQDAINAQEREAAERKRKEDEATAEKKRKEEAAAADQRRREAAEAAEREARIAADPVPALRKILALCNDKAQKDDALVRSTVAGVASGTLFQIDELSAKARREKRSQKAAA